METLKLDDLSIESHFDPACLRLQWRGRSTARDPAKLLAPYFHTAFGAAADKRMPIEMHFEDLEHFNSSTISALIEAIQLARAQRTLLVLVYRAELKWQRLSFEALRVFQSDHVSLRAV